MQKELADGTIVDMTSEEEQSLQDVFANTPVKNVTKITKLQCKKQAVSESLWVAVKGALDSDPEMKEDWELASHLDITDPGVIAMGTAMGKDSAQLQEFFNNAALT